MVKFILKDESEFTGEVNRIAGRSLIVTGLLVFSDGVVSNLMNAAIAVDAIEEIIAADELEAAMIELARNYQPPEATRPEIRPPPRWLVKFRINLPSDHVNARAFFSVKTPGGQAIAEATKLNLENKTAIVELPAPPTGGYITYERKGRRYKRNLEMTSVQEAM
ncbi:MAG: hypothetical protein QXG35_10055 [Nitrososphaerota archaeon]